MPEHITGLVAAPFTAFHVDGSLNLDKVEIQAESLVLSGVGGAFVCGTTGESLSLTVPERLALAERWRAVAPDGFAVIVHVGHPCTEDAKTLAAHAQKVGARAIGAMAPCFFRPASTDDLVAWCAEVAAAAPELPFYYYHIPSMTGVNVPVAEFLDRAAERIPTLAGAKFTYENLMDYHRSVRLREGRYDILFGRDEILLSALVLGARGAVGTTYNFAAPLYRRVIEAFERGDLGGAQAAQLRAVEMIQTLLRHGGLPAFKAVMKMIRVDCGPVRPPLRDLTLEQRHHLHQDLERLGFFDYCSRCQRT
ncbi:MAG TPA: dihydrodipicolinate synthase family protein [Planctomycetota bacterium]|nr:dihydrodipicolinate synthase family protein [Planctomycetota bacterium]HRR80276.1 dihydrodipicolinate synthase family protein [Planctomycetota bacterium]HRT93384.1 dihydrodipicolinate synthase family protein [Planctomycetota bacterium]